jgi:hypothetical protein
MLVLAQRGQFSFTQLVIKCHGDIKSQLELTLQIVKTASMLQKKYGFFLFTTGMIRASRALSLLLWVNEDEVNNDPQFPIGPLIPLHFESLREKDPKPKASNDPMHLMVRSLFQVLS